MLPARTVLADLVLLRRRIFALLLGAVAIIGGMTAWITRSAAVRQLDIIRQGLSDNGADTTRGACAVLASHFDTTGCAATLGVQTDRVFTDSLLSQYSKVIEAATATSGTGVLGFAARQIGSMVGFVTIALLLAIHICGPWEFGTARALIATAGTKVLIVQKGVTGLLAVLCLPLVCSVGVAVGHFIPLDRALPPPHPTPAADLTQLGRCYVVLLVVASLVFALALLTRSMVATFVITIAVLGVSFVGTLDPSLYRWSPAAWIATVMQFSSDDHRQIVDSLWTPWIPSLVSQGWAFAAIIALALIPVTVAIWSLPRRRPIA